MSAEVYGKNADNNALVEAVAAGTADILKATGVSSAEAHTSGERAARYAAEVLLSALEMTGELQPSAAADGHMIDLVGQITQMTVDPAKIPAFETGDLHG